MTQEWLKSSLGKALLRQEARVIEEALDGVFGEQCLQLGLWGERRAFLRFTRTQQCSLIAESLAEAEDGQPCMVGEMHRLPVESDSVDAVLLPHTLDYSDRPHAVLREVDRVLRRNGCLIILGFKPGGLWGLRWFRYRYVGRGQQSGFRSARRSLGHRTSDEFRDYGLSGPACLLR